TSHRHPVVANEAAKHECGSLPPNNLRKKGSCDHTHDTSLRRAGLVSTEESDRPIDKATEKKKHHQPINPHSRT
ncbi:hypothetical protein N9085_02835, partial [Akkermansiaceae bacterium]|nr:hypothetical protein [Akkermansiaceae bacterium]